MDSIYNAIQNLYNMDKTTWQEVLSELYNLVANVENKFDLFELKFGSLLGEQIIRELNKMYDDGSLASLINDKLLKDINTKVDTFKTEVSEQLDTKANKNDFIYIYERDFKDLPFSDNDESVRFLAFINKVQSLGGGEIQFTKAKYDFTSNVIIPAIDSITLTGKCCLHSDNKGTIFNFNNSVNFIEFTQLNCCKINDICFQGNKTTSKVGVTIHQAIWSDFNNCSFRQFDVNTHIKKFAYLRFNECRFWGENCTTNVKIADGNFPEFLYFNRCAFDGGYPPTTQPTLIEVKKGHYIYFNNCDITNTLGKAIHINPIGGECQDVYFNNCTIMHSYGGIEIGNGADHVKNVVFNDCLLEFDGDVIGKGFIVNNTSNSYKTVFSVNNLILRCGSKTALPEQILEFKGGAKVQGKFNVKYSDYTLSEMNFLGNYFASYFSIELPQDILRTSGKLTLNGNGGKLYEFTIATKSPFTTVTLPCFVNEFSDSGFFYKAICNSTQNGTLKIKVYSNENITTGTTVTLGYTILTLPYFN